MAQPSLALAGSWLAHTAQLWRQASAFCCFLLSLHFQLQRWVLAEQSVMLLEKPVRNSELCYFNTLQSCWDSVHNQLYWLFCEATNLLSSNCGDKTDLVIDWLMKFLQHLREIGSASVCRHVLAEAKAFFIIMSHTQSGQTHWGRRYYGNKTDFCAAAAQYSLCCHFTKTNETGTSDFEMREKNWHTWDCPVLSGLPSWLFLVWAKPVAASHHSSSSGCWGSLHTHRSSEEQSESMFEHKDCCACRLCLACCITAKFENKTSPHHTLLQVGLDA